MLLRGPFMKNSYVFEEKQKAEVVKYLKSAEGSLFKKGDPEAQYNLALCYENGRGKSKSECFSDLKSNREYH